MVEEQDKKGVHVDVEKWTKLPNSHLNAQDWVGLGAMAVIVYWWFCDKVTAAYDEDGISIGTVLFGNPVSMKTIANEKNLKCSRDTVQHHLERLCDRGLIRRKRHMTYQGYSFEVVGCAHEVLPDGAIKGKDGNTYYKNKQQPTKPELNRNALPWRRVEGTNVVLCELCEKNFGWEEIEAHMSQCRPFDVEEDDDLA